MHHANAHAIFTLATRLAVISDRISRLYGLPDAEKDNARRAIVFLCALTMVEMDAFLQGAFIPLDGPNEATLKRTAGNVQRILRAHGKLIHTPGPLPPDMALAEIVAAVNEFSQALGLDAPRINLFFVPQRLAYDTGTLLDAAERAIPNADLLTPEATADVREAGRCLALQIPTATAFHVLRACELVMRQYLKVLGGDEPQEDWVWAQYIDAIARTRRAPKWLVPRLHRLRDLERNDLFHVKRPLLSPEEGAEVFNYVNTAIAAMLSHLAELRSAGSL